jgi:hypothetical protein
MMKKLYFLLIAGFLISLNTKSQVVINEFSVSNLTQYLDNHSDYNDWFELYNTGSTSVTLTGYYLSDDSINTMKWQVPAGISISAGGFLRFWASGRNEVVGTSYHTNFKLTQTKNTAEFIVLADAGGLILDYVKLNSGNKTQLGHSRGRKPNGSGSWFVFKAPSPNVSNNSAPAYTGYATKPSFDIPAGFYPGAVSVTITNNEPSSTVYYTTDGTLPTTASAVYSAPVTLSTTKVLKALAKNTDTLILSSFVEFNTYFVNEPHTMSVVSIAGTSLTTLANGSGSLRPFGSCEYFDVNGNRTAKTYGEFNKHGQDSWANSQRSLDFISRDEMGYNSAIKEQLFPNSPRDSYQRVIFRAAGDDNFPADYSPQNAGSAHVRDAYVHMLANIGGMDLDVRRSVKTLIFINGQYWGVYDIRENPDEHDFTDYYYGQDKFNLQYIETWGSTWAEYGGTQAITDWSTLRSYILANSMTNASNFQYVTDQLDVYSLADYVIVNSFTVCTDWLNYNTGWWRGLDTTGQHRKWGYILWDNDATFDFYINYTQVPNTNYNAPPCNPQTLANVYDDPQQHLDVLNKLLTNPTYQTWFRNRCIDLWNTVFSCDNMLFQFDSVVAVIAPEMPRHSTRWGGVLTDWQNNVQTLRTFIQNRCNYMSSGFMNCYNLTGPYEIVLNVDPPNSGTIDLNSLHLTQFPWSGTYFGNINTSLTANADSAYVFNNWSSFSQTFSPNSTTAAVTSNLNASDTITAHFDLITSIGNYPGIDIGVSVYPTVFSEEATIEYTLPSRLPITIQLTSILGAEIANVNSPSQFQNRGNYSLKLNMEGSKLEPGVYMIKFMAGEYHKTVKIVYAGK